MNILNQVYVSGSKPTGGDHRGKYHIQVIDYDGTVITSDHLDAGATFVLPNPPQHEGVTFKEWASVVDIIDNRITVGEFPITIGATYTSDDGYLWIWFNPTSDITGMRYVVADEIITGGIIYKNVNSDGFMPERFTSPVKIKGLKSGLFVGCRLTKAIIPNDEEIKNLQYQIFGVIVGALGDESTYSSGIREILICDGVTRFNPIYDTDKLYRAYFDTDIKTIVFPNSIVYAGGWHSESLDTVVFGNGIRTMYCGDFLHCPKLHEVTISKETEINKPAPYLSNAIYPTFGDQTTVYRA